MKPLNLLRFDCCWLMWNGYKKKASRSEFESKVRSIKRTLRTNSVFLVVLLLLGRKTKKKPLKLFKIHHWNDKEWELGHTISNMKPALLKWFPSMRGNNIPINGPILQEKAHEFAKAFNYNDFTASNRWLRGLKER